MKKVIFIVILIFSQTYIQPALSAKPEHYKDVINTFRMNPERAKKIYASRKHLVYGQISRISTNWFYIFLKFQNDFQIRLPVKAKASIDKLKAGDYIIVFGTVARQFPGTWLQMGDAEVLHVYNRKLRKWE